MITVINDQFSIIILLGIAGEDSTTEGLWCGVQGGLRFLLVIRKNSTAHATHLVELP